MTYVLHNSDFVQELLTSGRVKLRCRANQVLAMCGYPGVVEDPRGLPSEKAS